MMNNYMTIIPIIIFFFVVVGGAIGMKLLGDKLERDKKYYEEKKLHSKERVEVIE